MRIFAGIAAALIATAQFGGAQPQLPAPPPGPGGGLSPYASLPAGPTRANPLDKLTPVKDADLIHPRDGEWLTWRRTYDDVGFSPLKQIDRGNVGNLRVAWTWSLANGPNEM